MSESAYQFEAVPCFGEAEWREAPQLARGDGHINPAKLSDEEFKTLVAQIRAGEVRSLRFRARVFLDKRNANLTRPEPGSLPALASGAKGALYLYNHASYDAGERYGTVTAAGTEPRSGVDSLWVEIDAIDPKAQEDFVRGKSDRFSIRVSAKEAYCSVCQSPARSGYFGPRMSCDHEAGKSYTTGDGKRVLAEVFLRGCRLVEVSSVNIPAVSDTAVLSAYTRANAEGGPLWPQLSTHTAPHPAPRTEAPMADQQQTQPPAPAAPEAPTTDHSAELAAVRAQLEQERAARKKADESAFSAHFNAGVTRGVVTPAELEHQRQVFSAIGLDAWKAGLDLRQPVAGYARQPVGVTAAAPPPPGTAGQAQSDDLALARVLHESGYLEQEPTPEALKKIGFHKLNFCD